MSKKILVFGASGSPTSINLQFAKYASSFLAPHEVTVIDFANYVPETIYVQGREKGTVPKQVVEFRQLLDTHDAVVVSFSENNAGCTAAWKCMLDWLTRTVPGEKAEEGYSKTFQGKPWLLLAASPSPWGAMTTLSNAFQFYPYLGAKVTGKLSLPNYYKNFVDGKLVDENIDNQLKQECQNLLNALE